MKINNIKSKIISGITILSLLYVGWCGYILFPIDNAITVAGAKVSGTRTPLYWNIETVDSGGAGMYISLCVDSSGNPHISYNRIDSSTFSSELRYAKWTGSTWSIEAVDMGLLFPFEYTSIALNSSGYPHISYRDSLTSSLKYAQWDGTSWYIESVDDSGDTGGFTAIAVDASGYPHISYKDYSNGDLKYAKWTGSAWDIQTVDAEGDVGNCTSLALDTAGDPHISYTDGTNYDLKYAYWNGTSWEIEPVDVEGNVGTYTSIALDSNGYPHISYSDDTNADLKYAKWTGSAWSIETVDSTDNVGLFTSLALGTTEDDAHIAYWDYTNNDLKYAHWSGSAWEIEIVDSAGDVGGFASIAIDTMANVHIAYFDDTNDALKYAKGILSGVNNPPSPPTSIFPDTTTDPTPHIEWSGASDPDGDTLSYFIQLGTTSSGSEIFGWTSTGGNNYYDITEPLAIGTYYVQVMANDGLLNSTVLEELMEIIAEPNNPPYPPTSILPDSTSDTTPHITWSGASDPDGDHLDYYIQLGTATGSDDIFSWTSTNYNEYYDVTTPLEVGTYYVQLKAFDGTDYSETHEELMEITVINNPPLVPAVPDGETSGIVGSVYSYSTSTSDPDGDMLRYGWDFDGDCVVDEWSELVVSGAIDTRTHSWETAGTYEIRVKAEDEYGALSTWSDALVVTIQSAYVNQPPEPPTEILPDTTTDTTPRIEWSGASDPDGDMLNYFIQLGKTSGGAEEFAWTSTGSDTYYEVTTPLSPGTYYVQLKSYDGIDYSEVREETMEIVAVNTAPTISSLPDVILVEDSYLDNAIDLWEYTTDAETEVDKLVFNIIEVFNPECGVSLDANRYIDVQPEPDWYGGSTVNLEVSDGELTATATFMVLVEPVNDPPSIICNTTEVTVTANVSYRLYIQISDIDNELTELTVTTNSSYVSYDWTNTSVLVLLYPPGVDWEMVQVTVSDGEAEAYAYIQVTVLPPPAVESIDTDEEANGIPEDDEVPQEDERIGKVAGEFPILPLITLVVALIVIVTCVIVFWLHKRKKRREYYPRRLKFVQL